MDHIQNITPQPPEVNAILKSFETPVSLYTGSPDITIPIYNIKEGDINFDVKLSYNSTGITVGERASWVGLGWNLSVPTLVRNVRQVADDFSYGFFYETQYTVNAVNSITSVVTPNTPFSQIGAVCPQCNEVNQKYKAGLLDLESDDYRITLPDGKSISFMVNQERDTEHPIGHIVQFPDSDYKIQYIPSTGNWEVINPSGYKYVYIIGNKIILQNTYTHGGNSLGNQNPVKIQPYITTWVLSKIISPNNNILNFDYDSVLYEDCDLINQTKTVSYDETAFPSEARNMVYSNYSKTRGTNFYISRIWGDFGEVIFNKDSRLDFTTYGRKLNNIEIKTKTRLINKIVFDYDYMISVPTAPKYTCNRFEDENDISKRLMLKKIRLNDNSTQSISYQFNYNSQILPNRFSYARDWWGYYNGEDSNTGLTPSIDIVMIEDNKRNVNPEFAKAGILEEIIYPTGGKAKFQFESNRGIFYSYNNAALQKIHNIIPIKQKHALFSTHEDDTQLLNKVYQTPLTLNIEELTSEGLQTIELNTTTTKCIYPENSLPYINSCSIYYSILDNSNDIIVGRGLLLNGYSRTLQVPKSKLLNGLKVKMEVYAGKIGHETQYFNYLQDEAAINLSYKVIDTALAKNTSYGSEVPFGGLRIKRIENYENIQNPIIKEYDYKNDGIETGISLFELDFLQSIPGKLFVTSQSRFPMQTGNGSLIAYTNAKEYKINSITNEKFSNSHLFLNNYLLGSYIGSCVFNQGMGGGLESASVPCFEDPRNGKSLFSDYSDKKTESSEYHDIYSTGKNLNWVYGIDYDRVVKPSDFIYLLPGSANPTFLGADYFYYKFKNFDEPDYSKESKYILNGKELITKIEYKSLSPDHHQITNEITILSDGKTNETTYQYAHEKANQLMIDKNMIGIPLETTTTRTINGTTKTLGKTETIYPTSLPTSQTGNLVLPTSVLSYDLQNPTSSTTEVTYDKYDNKGNIQQYTTKDGIPTAIIWGYNNTQPIAKVVGATHAQVSSLAAVIISASDTDASAIPGNDETAILTALDTFRKDSSMAGYQITTYTYDPLIGVRSITPPSGTREVYLYDSANRLMEIREGSQTGKLLKEFKYNYKN